MKNNCNLYFEEYFFYLLRIVKAKKEQYSELLKTLHMEDYIWEVPEDRRRAMDGLSLREDFLADFCGLIDEEELISFQNFPCSVLEMLVALAIRVDEEYLSDLKEPHPEKIFWEMIDNLGLKKYENRAFLREKVKNVISHFLKKSRKTVFPCQKKWPKGYEKWEIWAQMTHYLSENHYF